MGEVTRNGGGFGHLASEMLQRSIEKSIRQDLVLIKHCFYA